MPRSCINKHQYMSENIGSWIVSRCFQKRVKRGRLADELGISRQGLSWKLHNNSFTYADMLTVFDILGSSDEEILQVMRL